MPRDYLEAGRVLLAFGAVSYILIGIAYSPLPIPLEKSIASVLVGFFLSLGVYSFNYWTDGKEDSINEPGSAIVSGKKTPSQILVFSFLCKILAVIFAFAVSWESFLMVSFVVLVSFIYSHRGTFGVRIKEFGKAFAYHCPGLSPRWFHCCPARLCWSRLLSCCFSFFSFTR